MNETPKEKQFAPAKNNKTEKHKTKRTNRKTKAKRC